MNLFNQSYSYKIKEPSAHVSDLYDCGGGGIDAP